MPHTPHISSFQVHNLFHRCIVETRLQSNVNSQSKDQRNQNPQHITQGYTKDPDDQTAQLRQNTIEFKQPITVTKSLGGDV